MTKQDQHLQAWEKVDEKSLIDNRYLSVTKNSYRLPNGNVIDDFYVAHEHPGVLTVALNQDNEVLVVKQYRPAVDKVVYDFPGGFIEGKDASPLDRAKGELREETGYVSDEWTELGNFYPMPHRVQKKEYAFLAQNCTKVTKQQLDEDEFVAYELMPLPKLRELIAEGLFTCGSCLAVFLKASVVGAL